MLRRCPRRTGVKKVSMGDRRPAAVGVLGAICTQCHGYDGGSKQQRRKREILRLRARRTSAAVIPSSPHLENSPFVTGQCSGRRSRGISSADCYAHRGRQEEDASPIAALQLALQPSGQDLLLLFHLFNRRRRLCRAFHSWALVSFTLFAFCCCLSLPRFAFCRFLPPCIPTLPL
ncbi:hypothetical protein V3C99_015580 [Haemonchus contortus]